MSVPTTSLSVTYTGNGSDETLYVISYPFLDTAHIFAEVSSDGEEAAVALAPSEYVVARNADGAGGTLRTTEAVTSPATIRIFRVLPLTQPQTFQAAGPFPARSNETMGDRLLMQIQQVNAALVALGGEPSTPVDDGSNAGTLTWLDATARAAVLPIFAGQVGIERETLTLWIAQSATVGDWEEFQPRRTNQIVLGFTSDAGDPTDEQDDVAALFADWGVDYALFAGDNNYNGAAGFTADWAAFADFIAAGTAYPALGNHDMDETGWEARYLAKFPYLPRQRYYTVTLGDGLVDLFVLNSGRNTDWDLTEEDGNDVDSVQHAWFVAALAASKARWKIVMFHHPPLSLTDDLSGRIEPEMDWPEFSQVDLILCGHVHMTEGLKFKNVALWNMSSVGRTSGTAGAFLQGGSHSDTSLWAEDETACCGRIVASEEKLTIEVWSLETVYGRVLHTRDARDFIRAPRIVETFQVLPFQTALPEGPEILYVTTTALPMILRGVLIGFTQTDTEPVEWILYGGAVQLAAGELIGTMDMLGTDENMIPAGTIITISIQHDSSDHSGLTVALLTERHS